MDASAIAIKIKRMEVLLEQYAKQQQYFIGNPEFKAESAEYRQELVETLVHSIREAYVELCIFADEKQREALDGVYKSFDETHADFVGNIRHWIDKHKLHKSSSQASEHLNSTQKPKIKFPTISLPEFDGSLEKWLEYRDTFESLVHNNASLQTIEKYHYLRTSIKLPSGHANILQNFTLSADFYEAAWTAVKDRYDDKRKLKSQHFNMLLSIKKMTSETPAELRRVLDSFSSTITTLKQLGATFDDLLVHVVQFRLDDQTQKDWQKEAFDDEPTWQELNDFLKNQWRRLDQVQPAKKTQQRSADNKSSSHESAVKAKSFTSGGQKPISCSLCKELHRLYQCEKFKALTSYDRFRHVKKLNLCRNCLMSDHQATQCKSQNRCRQCSRNHHTLLHFDNASSSGSSHPSNEVQAPSSPGSAASSSLNPNVQSYSQQSSRLPPPQPRSNLATQSFLVIDQALLSTVLIKVKDAFGNEQICRALMDSGSMTNYMTTAAARRLGLRMANTCIPITGINDKTSVVRHTVQAHFSSRYQQYEKSIQCSILDNITGMLPSFAINRSRLTIPDDFQLADPEFHRPAPVDMLLGTTIHFESQINGKFRIPEGLILQHTLFGWTVGGEQDERIFDRTNTSTFLTCFAPMCHVGIEEIDLKLEKFMEVENSGMTKKIFSPEEQHCVDLFNQTTKKDDEGRFVVQHPFKTNISQLKSNYSKAHRQFFYQEKLRQKDEAVIKLATEYMDEYISSGHMKEVEINTEDGYFLPSHGVKKATSTTTKWRPVFNGSSEDENGLSLNQCLSVGPTIQPESFDIMFRFREKPFVLKSDIEKMYRQVRVDESQCKYQKILWRSNPSQPVKHFQLMTVTFGLASSAYQATQALTQVAVENETEFPEAAKVIKDSFFVDDLMVGFDSVEQALKIRDHLRYLLSRSHFPLRKWASNDDRLLRNLHPKHIDEIKNDESSIKALGHNWFPRKDQLSLCFKQPTTDVTTKASILSDIASMYDPLGLIGPVVLKAKLFMKTLWQHKLSWNQEVPQDITDSWNEFRRFISSISDVIMNRTVTISNPQHIELHGFCDASESAYGAVVYVRSADINGNVQVSLVCSKSRVSPTKQQTIARLELCSAVLLSKLVSRIVSISSLQFSSINLWSDSMITLHWIRAHSSRLSTFVGNRAAVIQELTSSFVWRHIRTEDNPADVISRGFLPHHIQSCSIWWNGPTFIAQPQDEWPESLLTINEDDPCYAKEFRKSFPATPDFDLFIYIETKHSRINVLINSFVYMRRFKVNARKGAIKIVGLPTIEEREQATLIIIRIIQQSMFSKEYKYMTQLLDDPNFKQEFPRKSSILSLAPFMDKVDRVIRVGGRIQASSGLTFNQKHPIILPEGHFAKLIIRDAHIKHLHQGAQALLSTVREQYWPIHAQSIVRKVIHECLICYKVRPKLATQYMASLPEARVIMTSPFSSTSVDYAGYFNIRSSLTNKNTIVKAYVAMFKCMCTGAIHLEAVTKLSTEAFIAAFDRFIARRGLSKEIFSDNGTNFVGADNEFKKILKEAEPSIAAHLQEKFIAWHFTTPLAPHAGGYYESGIKTMKHHLMRIMQDDSYDFEQFSTILCKIEAIINSRPLTPMSEDPSDLQVLTPGHFLIGKSLTTKPERNLIDVPANRVDRWNKLQRTQQIIWNAWYHDYLNQLQARPNKFRIQNQFEIGDMVLVKDNNLPPMKWIYGRISDLFPGRDNVVRNVRIRTMNNNKEHFLHRHIKYLCLLPFEQLSSAGQCVSDDNQNS